MEIYVATVGHGVVLQPGRGHSDSALGARTSDGAASLTERWVRARKREHDLRSAHTRYGLHVWRPRPRRAHAIEPKRVVAVPKARA